MRGRCRRVRIGVAQAGELSPGRRQLFHRSDPPGGRQRGQQGSTVTATYDAPVQEGDDAGISLGAYEPPESLLEGHRSRGDRVLGESAPPVLVETSAAR